MLASFAHAVQNIVNDLGYPGLFLLVVLESTLVPVPSLLVFPFAGFLAHQGVFSLPVILLLNTVGALTGSALSYWVGIKGGKPFLVRYGKYFFVNAGDIISIVGNSGEMTDGPHLHFELWHNGNSLNPQEFVTF